MKKLIALFKLAVLAFIFLTPIVVIFTNSFMSETEINMNYNPVVTIFDYNDGNTNAFMKLKIIPSGFTLKHYINSLFFNPTFLILLGNSVKILAPIILLNPIVSILSAYGFHTWSFKYKNAIYNIYILIMLAPVQAVILPNYIIANKLNLINSHLSVILPGIFFPFGSFLIRQALRGMPDEYLEAGKIDGAGEFKILLYLVVPQIKTAVTALIILLFTDNWNLVEQIIILLKDFSKEPLSLYLSRINDYSKSAILSASCLYMLAPVWIVIYFQNELQSGIELSGIK